MISFLTDISTPQHGEDFVTLRRRGERTTIYADVGGDHDLHRRGEGTTIYNCLLQIQHQFIRNY